MTREELLKLHKSDESHVERDKKGEYIRGWVEIGQNCTSYPKIYLPK